MGAITYLLIRLKNILISYIPPKYLYNFTPTFLRNYFNLTKFIYFGNLVNMIKFNFN